ncbi:MAG: alpha/beta hydrolase [Bacteroidota bacterium]
MEGNKIHYKVDGIGKELMMVHGGYLDLSMWDKQVNEFENDWRIVRFSDLGHGKTQSKGQPIYGREIIEKLTGATSENPTTLVGLSWGAMICVDYALKYPDKVDKLVLVSPGLSSWPYFQDSIAAKNNALRKAAIKNGDIQRAASLFHQSWVVGPRREPSSIDKAFYEWSLTTIAQNMQNH